METLSSLDSTGGSVGPTEEWEMIYENRLRPEALATLRTNRSIDKMVKSFVRKPVSNRNLQPKHLQYRPPLSLSLSSLVPDTNAMNTLNSSASMSDLQSEQHSQTRSHYQHQPQGRTDYVGIGVGGGAGVEMNASVSISRASSHASRESCTPPPDYYPYASAEEDGVAALDSRLAPNPLPHRPASRLQFMKQPNHNNGSPRSPKRSDHYLPIWNDVSSPADFPPAPGRIDIRGALIPSSVIKDGMIDLVRKHDTAQRKRFVDQKKQAECDHQNVPNSDASTKSKSKPKLKSVSGDNSDIVKFMKKGEMGFEDSFHSNLDDEKLTLYPDDGSEQSDLFDFRTSLNGLSASQIKSSKSYMDLTQKSKLSTITRPEDDYSVKWMKMKKQRDERREREIRRAARAQILQTFSQVVYNTERNDIQRALLNKRDESYLSSDHKEAIQIRRQQQTDALRRRLEGEKLRKKEEVDKIKLAIKSTMEMANVIKANHLLEKKSKVSESSFILDDASSTIVSIPQEMSVRLKDAKSLKAYEHAKSEIKNFQESSLSNRFAALAKSREDAIVRTANLGCARIVLSPLKTASVFSDSVTLQSDPTFLISAESRLFEDIADQRDKLELQMTDSIGDDLSYASNSTISSHGSRRSLKSRESLKDRQFRELEEKFRKEDLHAQANRKVVLQAGDAFEQKISEFGLKPTEKKKKKFHPDWPKKYQIFGEEGKT